MRGSLAAALLAACAVASAQFAPPEYPVPFDALRDWFDTTSVITDGAFGCHRVDALLADTPARRSRGLMFVNAMPADAGMLFVYPSARPVSMWMKNTLIPLDIVFIGDDRRIVSIARDAVPLSLASIAAAAPAAYALELNAGRADALGLAPAQRLHLWPPEP